jgi:hypothetical protein
MKLEVRCDTQTGTEVVDVEDVWSVKIVSRDGEAIQVVELRDGSFEVTAVTSLGCKLTIQPVAQNEVVLKAEEA